MMYAAIQDARYQPGAQMIADNRNLQRQVKELEERLAFYTTMWENAADDAARYKRLYVQEVRARMQEHVARSAQARPDERGQSYCAVRPGKRRSWGGKA